MRHAWTLAILTWIPATALAQPPATPIARIDVAGSIGLFSADRADGATDCCSSWSGSFFRGLSAGYYWTDHLKTEVEFGIPGPTQAYSYSTRPLSDRTFGSFQDDRTYTGSKLSFAQAYQFGYNAPFHPYAFAGIDVDREHVDLERRSFIGVPPFQIVERSSTTDVHGRGFAGAGFKAYVSEHAFFKGEMKLAIGERLEQMTWKAGVGVDFSARRRSAGDGTTARGSRTAAVPRGRDPVDVWRAYATLLPLGSVVDVSAAGDDPIIAELLEVDDQGILVKPRTRVREANRRIAFDVLEQLRLHLGPSPAERFGAVAAGVGTGTGLFFGILVLILAAAGN
jgi:hypothetical protein